MVEKLLLAFENGLPWERLYEAVEVGMQLSPAQNQHICSHRHRKQCPTISGKGISCESKQWYTSIVYGDQIMLHSCSPSAAIGHLLHGLFE